MGGAFTAVADDATASWWNPAGVAAGAFLNLIIEYGEATDSPASPPGHGGFSIAFPALGIGYYRMTVSDIRPPATSTAGGAAGRQDTGTPSVRSLELSQLGATVGQSLGNHIVVASTLKWLRAEDDSQGALDIGAMTIYGIVRAGVMVRNVTESTFGADADAITLKRQVRGGFAVSSATSTAFGGATIAVDADFLAVPTALGDERRIAVGTELWAKSRWLGGRAGFSTSTLGESRTAVSGGVSVAIRHGMFAEAQLTGGSDAVRKGWSTALRLTF